eukprot:TRINITY_DN621_c0_g1_i1.p1 TRINITY_DN621_c0_g1~~TRINITY_DN621_c0_g1_i1.p1  ORF type:complete len:365 (+),score=71.90 TRINITY_DN621_c0_g1_i1:99-1193(+)
MKVLVFFIFFALVSSLQLPLEKTESEPDWRLIEFNETYRQWMPFDKVLELIEECGKGHKGGFMDVTEHPEEPPKIALPSFDYPTTFRFEDDFVRLNASVDKEQIKKTIETLSAFQNRYYTSSTGVAAANWILEKFQEHITSSGRTDASVEFFKHSWSQSSVIAKIRGTTNEVIILGAHEDSIVSSMRADSRAPGADDDASGTATVLEVFRVLVGDPTFKPLKTVEFHTYAAEEVGLLGSQDIAANYRSRNVIVPAMVQFDMTAFTNGRPAFVTDQVSSVLTKSLMGLATKYTTLSFTETTCGYGCSDHASWTKYNYPSAFPFETIFRNSNSRIHTSNDLISFLNMDQAREFAALGVGFALEYSK